jgi:iron(III) transport system permease protein
MTVDVIADPAMPAARQRSLSGGVWLLFGLSVLAVLFFIVLPLGAIVWQSFQSEDGAFTFANYVSFAHSSRLLQATANTLLVAVASAVGSIVIATPLALGVTRTAMRGKRLVRLATIITFATPAFLVALAYILLAGPNAGFINLFLRSLLHLNINRGPLDILSVWGFILLSLPQTVAFAFMVMVPAFENMDLAMEEASRIAGIGPIETIFSITLPVMRASILAGALLAFSTGLAEFAVPYLLGVDVLTVSMRGAIYAADFGTAAAIAAISAVMSLVVLVLYRRSISGSLRYRTVVGRGVRVGQLDIGMWRHLFTGLGVAYSLLGAIVPSILLVLISFMGETGRGFSPDNFTFRNYAFILNTPLVQQGLVNSLILGVIAATIIALLGFVLAYIMTKTAVFGRGLIDYLSILPLGVAGVAFGVGTILANLDTPLVNLGLYGTIWILLIAYIGRYIPFGVRSAQVALLQLSTELEEASRVSGSGQWRTIWRITFPLVRPAIGYAWIFGFVQAFSEVSASSVLAGAQNPVSATALLNLYNSDYGLQRACAVGVLMFAITMLLVAIAQRLGGRGIGDYSA